MSPFASADDFIFWILAALACGSLAYCAISIYAALEFLRRRKPSALETVLAGFTPPVSLLKPLYGTDRELEASLRSFFEQDYPNFEILFSVREEPDPAVAVLRRVQQDFPLIPSRLLALGPPRYVNAKVHGLEAMMEAAAHEILVISDSDVRVSPDYLRSVVAPLLDPRTGMTTVLSRGVAGKSLWSKLETLGMNTQFIPGVLAAWVLMGLKFSLGPTMVVRKKLVSQMGGFGVLGDYLADDFVLGERIAQMGHKVELAGNVPDHLVYNDSFSHSLAHRLRWERSSRRSRPAGYVGQIFMHTLPLAALAWLAAPAGSYWGATILVLALAARFLQAGITAGPVLREKAFARYWWLLPVQDTVSFLIWLAAFFGKEVEWRGARFRVLPGGKLQRAGSAK